MARAPGAAHVKKRRASCDSSSGRTRREAGLWLWLDAGYRYQQSRFGQLLACAGMGNGRYRHRAKVVVLVVAGPGHVGTGWA